MRQRYTSSALAPSILASLFLVAACILSQSPAAAADPLDTVWLEPTPAKQEEKPFTPRSIIRRQGTVESFDDQALEFIPAGEERSIRVASSRVIWAEPGFADAETTAAVAMFRAGRYKEAIAPLIEAITRRPSVWRAQWLSMHLWQAAYRAERYPAVLELVSQLDSRPLPALIIGGLPIHWIDERLPPAALQAAQGALAQASASPATQLVAASWLLGQSNDQPAVVILEALAEQRERPLLSSLAAAQLWRKVTPPKLREHGADWRSRLEKIPLTLSVGPAALLAHRLEAAGDQEQALELFLSIAITPARPHELVSYGRLRAVALLEQLGRPEEAVALHALNQ